MFWLFTLLNQCKPNVELSDFVEEKGSESWVGRHDVIHKVHEHNEHNNTCKLDEYRKEVFYTRATSVVAVSRCWYNRTYPVKGKDVQLVAIVCVKQWGFYSPWITLVPHQVIISHPKPNSHNQVNQNHKVENVN